MSDALASPHAAAVLRDLLGAIAGLPVAEALVAESLAYGKLQARPDHAAWLAVRKPVAPLPPGRVLTARGGDVLTITLDRPQAHNAIDVAMRDGLREAFEVAVHDPEVGRVVLRAAGKAFCIGADLSEFGTTRDPAEAHAIRMATLPAHAIAKCADRLEVQVQGGCIGAGLEMAAFARRIVAKPNAWFQLPELAMGLIPGAGGCVSVSRRIGAQRTLEMVLSGKRLSARTALEWGLIDSIG